MCANVTLTHTANLAEPSHCQPSLAKYRAQTCIAPALHCVTTVFKKRLVLLIGQQCPHEHDTLPLPIHSGFFALFAKILASKA